MQTHLTPRTLKGTQKPDKDVQVLFAAQPNRKALLFIHGFSGDAITTWSDFHELLPGCPKCAGHDLYFYGYDGLRADMTASASIFRGFLDRLLANTKLFLADNLPPSAKRGDEFAYDELVIVAHSLGAVISRRALIDATKNRSGWARRTKLFLFAPAHKGAKVADLALEAASSFPFLKLFGIVSRFESPLIDQLRPDSRVLRKLLDETELATRDGANPHLVACKVVIAEYEKIVENETFGEDPPPDTIPNATHTSVCKPTAGFLQPLDLLETCL
jgi:pimeloyl-ACP methyl ester carboxylesterase